MKFAVFGTLACAAVVNAATDPLSDDNDENIALATSLGVVGFLLCILMVLCAYYCSNDQYAQKNTFGGNAAVARTVYVDDASSSSSYYDYGF